MVQGSTVVPGTAFIEMALAAAATATGADAIEIEGFEIRRPVVIASGGDAAIEVSFSAEDGGFRLLAGETAGGAPPVVVARVAPLPIGAGRDTESLAAIRKRLVRRFGGKDIYRRFDRLGLHYGPAFQGIRGLGRGRQALGRIVATESIVNDLGDYCLHPAILDACLQVTLAAVPEDDERPGRAGPKQSRPHPRPLRRAAVAWCHAGDPDRQRSIVGSSRPRRGWSNDRRD